MDSLNHVLTFIKVPKSVLYNLHSVRKCSEVSSPTALRLLLVGSNSGVAPCRLLLVRGDSGTCIHQYLANELQRFDFRVLSKAGKQSKNPLVNLFERYIEGYMTFFDAIWSV